MSRASRHFSWRGWLIAALLLAAPHGHAAQPNSSTLRIALASDLRGTNPGVNRDSVTDWVTIHIVEPLLAIDGSLKPAPMLAQSWTVSADGREYRFRLRPGVKFHNGDVLRAQHVVWSWKRLLDPKTRWPCRPWFDGSGDAGIHIETIDAPDAMTVRFQLAEPNALFLYRLADIQCSAAILHPDSVDAQGKWRWPIGTGPYRLSEWQRGRYIRLDRFADYSPASGPPSGLAGRKQALLQTLRFVVIPDPSAIKLAMLSGEIDVWPVATTAESLPELRRDGQLRLLDEQSRDWSVLLMQNRNGVMRNPALRAAIASVLDPAMITNSTLHAERPPRPYAIPASDIDPEILARIPPAYQPLRTQDLLQEAGYHGELIEIDVARELTNYFNDAIVIHALLTRAGINARVRSMDWPTQFKRYWQGEYQLSVFGYTGRAAAPMMYSVFVCDPLKHADCVVHTPRSFDVLREMSNSSSSDSWPKLAGLLEEEIARDRSIVGLYAPLRMTTLRRDVHGYETWAMGLPRFWGVSLEAAQ